MVIEPILRPAFRSDYRGILAEFCRRRLNSPVLHPFPAGSALTLTVTLPFPLGSPRMEGLILSGHLGMAGDLGHAAPSEHSSTA